MEMISFFGLRKSLSKNNLWTNEKKHSAIIKKVKMASSCDLPMYILSIVFPQGWKSSETNWAKDYFCKKIKEAYPLPLPMVQPLEDISEQEMRTYIEKLDRALQRQFDGCLELLYGINCSDEKFSEIKQVFIKKFLKVSKQERLIAYFVFAWTIIFMLGVFVSIAKGVSGNNLAVFIMPFIIVFLLLGISSIFRTRYFKIGEDNYPTL